MNEQTFQRTALIVVLCAASGGAMAAAAAVEPAIDKVSVRSTAHFDFDRKRRLSRNRYRAATVR